MQTSYPPTVSKQQQLVTRLPIGNQTSTAQLSLYNRGGGNLYKMVKEDKVERAKLCLDSNIRTERGGLVFA